MSTVQDIYDLLQYRPDIQVNCDDLIPVVNRAIRSISKRLYVLESSLITAKMEVGVWSERSYTADIAFVDSNPDTLTDAASQFVVEDFRAGMPITTTHAGNPGPFRIGSVAAGIVTLDAAEAVIAATASSVAVTSDDTFGYLPADFWGLKQKPHIQGRTEPLQPLPSPETALRHPGAGDPVYYEVMGSKIYVVPCAGADITIRGDYYRRPAAVTGTSSEIPFNELFDELIAEYVEAGFRGPLNRQESLTMVLDKLIRDGVDLIAVKYENRGPAGFPRAVDWSRL
jgi:hypothetical protein